MNLSILYQAHRVPLSQLLPGADVLHVPQLDEIRERFQGLLDWKERLQVSSKESYGFAAPGGEFTKSAYLAALKRQGGLHPTLLKGKVALEIGAGLSPYGYLLARELGAGGYVAVEPYYADRLELALLEVIRRDRRLPPIGYTILAEDMLSALKRIPDRSVAVFAFGIEDCILAGASYRAAVEREVMRVLGEKAIYFSLRSDLVVEGGSVRKFLVERKKFIETASIISIE
ncbi:MAG: hypothetical protein J5J00_07655 [Deltaproteobacteria bacterium]|nr:hypothetical protein [Deltaproteobacteria bacterium]